MARKRFPDDVPPTKVNYTGGQPTSLNLRKCVLVILSDPARPTYGFVKDEVTIGAMQDNDIVLPDETVSRYHCRVAQEGDHYVLTDLESTNGTFVDDVRIRSAFLKPGCIIKVGKAELRFEAVDERHEVIPSSRERLGPVVGGSRRMREIFGILEKIAPTSATVVIEGETGTGKEVVAKSIHALSSRASKPFIIFDCGAVPDNLIESELFGHERGSFTGAIMSRRGLFEMAQEGTIFLDELCELDLDLQPKLLRVLEQREVRRVGSNKPIRVDVRVIAATNRNLEEEVRKGRFREDLFFRLSVVRIFMPPLRERREDLPLLIRHFLTQEGFNRKLDGSHRVEELSSEALDALLAYHWPGNVRELINVLERACSFAETKQINLSDLSEHLRQQSSLLMRPAADHSPETGLLLGGAPAVAPAATVSPVPPLPVAPPAPASVTPVVATATLAALEEQPAESGPLKTFKDAKEEWIGSFERDYLLHLLKKNRMNISHAARDADIDRKYFRKLMRKYGIEPAGIEEEE